jgi:hypothetical protein
MGGRKKIVIFHYHLKRGGVTSVIKEQIESLKDENDILIITGETPEFFIHDNLTVIPELGYTKISDSHFSVENSASKIIRSIEKYFNSRCDIIHFHNPILAKNHNMIKIINILSDQKNNIFLQIHDFAEDGRPASFFKDDYPENVHYGVINTRDYKFLLDSGLTKKGLHYIPNCIRALDYNNADFQKNNLILYPVRSIRRKNIGEIILLSLFLQKDDYMGITLPALNYNDLKSYEDWKIFVKKNKLKVEFDLGLKYEFNELIEKSKFFITTSITEGFGFTYLEPWMCGRFLFGRNIKQICEDFTSKGIDFNNLYEELLIPVTLIDKKYYINKIISELKTAEKYYDLKIDNKTILDYCEKRFEYGYIDFGLLSEKMQEEIILKIIIDNKLKNEILKANSKLSLLNSNPIDKNIIEKNRIIINKNYSRESYKKNLNEIYDKIIKTPVKQKLDKKILLSKFLQPESLYLLKWGSYDR